MTAQPARAGRLWGAWYACLPWFRAMYFATIALAILALFATALLTVTVVVWMVSVRVFDLSMGQGAVVGAIGAVWVLLVAMKLMIDR